MSITVTVNGQTGPNVTATNGDTIGVTVSQASAPGATGPAGPSGPANSLSIGAVSSGSSASATITGTAPTQTLNLVLPIGAAGATGGVGATGSSGPAGPANTLSIGTVSSGSSASATITGTAPSQTLNLVLPVGAVGATGATGPQGPAGSVNLADETPQPLGVASAGTALAAARADHVHAQGSIAYSALSGIPSTFAPSAHTHAISDVTGLQTQLDGKQAAGTYATLVSGTVPSSQLPSYVDDVIEYSALSAFPSTNDGGKIFVARDTGKIYRWSGSGYVEISPSPGSTDSVTEGSTNLYFTNARAAAAAPVQSVAGRTGTVTLAKADVGLGNVDNTADASKPVSTAQAAADAAVQAYAIQRANHTGTQAISTVSGLQAAIDGKASTSHTHSLADISQSSATSGQVPTWNGTAWAAATPSSGSGSYTLPTASDTVLGGIKVGTGLSISSGVLSATGGGGSGTDSLLRSLFVPPAPTGVAATPGNAQAALSWTAPTVLAQAPITDYTIQYSSDSGSSWTTFSDGTSTATSATVTGLTNGTAYTFRVAGVNAVGTGSYSTASSAVTPISGDLYFSNVALLLHMDGTGSTFVDSSGTPKSVSALGNATQSATQSRWGGKSLYLDGSGDYLTIPSSTSLDFAGNDFVVEMWFKTTQTASESTLICREWVSSPWDNAWTVQFLSSGVLRIFATSYSTSSPLLVGSTACRDGNWHHFAWVRSGSSHKLFLDGVVDASATSSASWTSATKDITVGNDLTFGSGSRAYEGYIDDLRITVGSARTYTGSSTITVPTAAFPDSGVTGSSKLTINRGSGGASTFTGSGTAASPYTRAARVRNDNADGLMAGVYTFTATASGTVYITCTFYDDASDSNNAFLQKNSVTQAPTFSDGATVTARAISVASGDVIRFSSSSTATSYANVSVWAV